MRELRDRLGLPLEPLPSLSAFGQMPRQDFDRDRAFKTRVACLVHFPHPARAERRQDLVGTETRACSDRQCLAPAIQLTTSVTGLSRSCAAIVTTRNRWPSAETS